MLRNQEKQALAAKINEVKIASIKAVRATVKSSIPLDHAAIIACSSYPIPQEALSEIGPQLLLHFDDTADPHRTAIFTPKLAEAVKRFLCDSGKHIATLYVCCDSGESRSAAIAAAILRSCGQSDAPVWRNPKFHPNPLVYRLQCEAFHIRVSAIGLKWRIRLNRRAFRRAQQASK